MKEIDVNFHKRHLVPCGVIIIQSHTVSRTKEVKTMQIYADTGSDSTQASHVLEVQRKGKTNALREKTL